MWKTCPSNVRIVAMQLNATGSHCADQVGQSLSREKCSKTCGTDEISGVWHARSRAMPARMRALVSAAAAAFAFDVGGGTACAALPFPSHATMMPPAFSAQADS